MSGTADGFEIEGRLPKPATPIPESAKTNGVLALAALMRGATPEEIAAYIEGDWPKEIVELCEQPLQQQELSDHLDILVYVLERRQLAAA